MFYIKLWKKAKCLEPDRESVSSLKPGWFRNVKCLLHSRSYNPHKARKGLLISRKRYWLTIVTTVLYLYVELPRGTCLNLQLTSDCKSFCFTHKILKFPDSWKMSIACENNIISSKGRYILTFKISDNFLTNIFFVPVPYEGPTYFFYFVRNFKTVGIRVKVRGSECVASVLSKADYSSESVIIQNPNDQWWLK